MTLVELISFEYIRARKNQTLNDILQTFEKKNGELHWALIVRNNEGNYLATTFEEIYKWEEKQIESNVTDSPFIEEIPILKPVKNIDLSSQVEASKQIASEQPYGFAIVTWRGVCRGIFYSQNPLLDEDHTKKNKEKSDSSYKKETKNKFSHRFIEFYKKYRIATIVSMIWLGITIIVQYLIPLMQTNMSDLLPYIFPPVMTAEWNVAIAGFTPTNDLQIPTSQINNINNVFYTRLLTEMKDLSSQVGFSVQVLGPEKTRPLRSNNPSDRLHEASVLAKEMKADMVIYGTIDSIDSQLKIKPEFFLNIRNNLEAEDIINGEHSLGSEILLPLNGNLIDQVTLNRELSRRSELLLLITKGLGLLINHYDEEALPLFETANDDQYWDFDDGREVINIFIGNAAMRAKMLERSKKAFENAVNINPEYSRAYLGLGDICYLSSISDSSNLDFNPTISDLNQALEFYDLALKSKQQPEYAEIPSKVAFGKSVVYLTRWIMGENSLKDAQSGFEYVIVKYGNGKNERLQDLASESHARLGLIKRQLKDYYGAINEYRQAHKLATNQARKGLYSINVGDLLTLQDKKIEGQSEYRNALSEFRAAVSLASQPARRAEYLSGLASCYERLDDYENAYKTLKNATNLLPEDSNDRHLYEDRLNRMKLDHKIISQ